MLKGSFAKTEKIMKLMICLLVVVSVAGSVQAQGIDTFYAYNTSQIISYDPDLSNQQILYTGYGGFVDMAASSNALYFTSGDILYRTDPDGSNLTSVLGIGVDVVAVNGDGYVYSYNGSDILRHDTDLSNQVVYSKGYGGFVDMAASSDALYFADGNGVYRTDLDGSNLTSVLGVYTTIVAAGPDGHVYAYNSVTGQILRYDSDLSNQVVSSASYLWYGGFIDMAASSDALYFAIGDGGIFRTELDGTDSTSSSGTGVTIVAVPLVPELLEGDANRDDVVSAGDYASVQANFGNTGVFGIPGDANGDGVVSAGDYASVQANFGNTAAGVEVVPEPTTMLLLVLGAVAALGRRNRKAQ